MKILGFMPCHYGKEYLQATLESVRDHVDHFLISYTPYPSYGHHGSVNCPESMEEIQSIAVDVLGGKLIWEEGTYDQEFQHRNRLRAWWGNYDMVFSVDADEVWSDADKAIQAAWDNPCHTVGVGGDRWKHFWRSFNEINTDGFYPIRFHKHRGENFSADKGIIHEGNVYHMGYAQSRIITEYKFTCHGHKGEIASNYFHDKWLNYVKGQTTHLHPASQDVWIETQDFDKTKLPDVLKKHPYYELDIIN